MTDHQLRSAEILFVKAVKDGIPNRDPLRDGDARRIFGQEDGRISLSDVSIKRDVRDYTLARYPDGGPNKNMFVFVRQERTGENKLMGRDRLAELLLERAGRAQDDDFQHALMQSAFDTRVFGAVFSVKKKSFHQCGPVQFGWAHSLHPVDTKYVQGTVVMPSRDVQVNADSGQEESASQGTIWTSYTCPFAMFAMPAVLNATIAAETGVTDDDVDFLLEALWNGTCHRQARGRGIQRPLLLVHVEYSDPFFRIGFLDETLAIEPDREAWLGPNPPTSLSDVTLNLDNLASALAENKNRVARYRVWAAPQLKTKNDLPVEAPLWAST